MSAKELRPSRIIIFRPGQLGDTLAAFPLIEGLRMSFPEVPLVYCTNRFRTQTRTHANQVIEQLNPHIAEVVSYFSEDSLLTKWQVLKNRLKPSPDDILLYATYANPGWVRAKRDWGFFRSLGFRNLRGFENNIKQAKFLPEYQRLINQTRESGLEIPEIRSCTIQADHFWARHLWQDFNPSLAPVVCVCPFSAMQSKRWPFERFIEVGRRWHEHTSCRLLILGGCEDREIGQRLADTWSGFGYSICGCTLDQTAAAIQRSQLYLGVDSGPMHLAGLLGKPCVAIFSSRASEGSWYPFGSSHAIMRNAITCEGCQRTTCFADPAPCLELTTVSDVFNALSRIWTQQLLHQRVNQA